MRNDLTGFVAFFESVHFTVDWIAKYSVAQNNLPLELDIGTDLAELKADLAKFKKGKHGKGLDDINIEELDWVSHNNFLDMTLKPRY